MAIKTVGTLWAWGSNDNGQLGDGTLNDSLVPVQVGTDANWLTVSTGDRISFAIKADGTLWAWGLNAYGRFGDGTKNDSMIPTQVGMNQHWIAVSSNQGITLAIRTDGTLWAWGNNIWDVGELGIGNIYYTDIPVQVGSGSGWVAVNTCGLYSVAIKSDGTLWTWGSNERGTLGDGTLGYSMVPIQVGY